MLIFRVCRARCRVVAVLLVALGCATPVANHAQGGQMGGIGLTVFADADYKGRNATFRNDTPDLAPYGMDDRISSLRVGPGEVWEVCELPNYQGRCQIFSGADTALRSSGWSDIISSARLVRDGNMSALPMPPPVVATLELFADDRFRGERRVLTGEVPDLGRLDFDDRAASIRLGRSQAWEVCLDRNYRGCRVVDTDWSELSELDLKRRISSLRPYRRGGVAPPVAEGRIVLFDDRNFKGRALPVDRAQPVLSGFQDKAESVQVTSGLWEICERAGFGGRCAMVSSNVTDLGALGLRNRVKSVRPRSGPY